MAGGQVGCKEMSSTAKGKRTEKGRSTCKKCKKKSSKKPPRKKTPGRVIGIKNLLKNGKEKKNAKDSPLKKGSYFLR